MAVAASPEVVEKTILESLGTMGAEPEMVTREATLEELDIDSLDLVELSQMVQEEFGFEVQAEEVKDIKTVGEAVDLIVSRVQ